MSYRKTWIKLKRGLLQPKHREALGIRLWLYLHILDRADWDSGSVIEWRDAAEAERLEMPAMTVRQQRRELEEAGYIRTERARDHLRLFVTKWVNPREYSGQVYNPSDMAVPYKTESGNIQPLSESETDNKTDNESGNKSGKSPSAFLRPSMSLTDSHSTDHMQEEAAPRPPKTNGFIRCERCGFLVSPAALPMRCEGAHFVRTLAGKEGVL